ncbi:hypothetical protein Nepgr_010490 [Nepenthes gracilis]|uniref:CAP-Gly domain-containing protein n=1 Tax=Nepenthes gracilis TaxID=150966 RepID=A0AAD3SDE0_NEPGR|nr:hypothetical protein Nepgr_010490 [Nepenthes gracilis]
MIFLRRVLNEECLHPPVSSYSLEGHEELQVMKGRAKSPVMGSRLQIQGDESVLLCVTHSNLKSFNAHVRFPLQMTLESVKEKLWKKSGTSVSSMCLELYDDTGSKIADLSDNMRPLGFYSPLDGFRLHVIDLDPSSVSSGGWLEDTSLVEKYKISEEAYDKLDGTYRKFKEKLKHQNPMSAGNKIAANYMENLCSNIKVGDRCQVEPGEKRGVVKYVGQAEDLGPGFWVGIQYDEPLGKHDGTVKGMRYFECPLLHGAMVRPDKVQVGDYPERDPFEEEEEI